MGMAEYFANNRKLRSSLAWKVWELWNLQWFAYYLSACQHCSRTVRTPSAPFSYCFPQNLLIPCYLHKHCIAQNFKINCWWVEDRNIEGSRCSKVPSNNQYTAFATSTGCRSAVRPFRPQNSSFRICMQFTFNCSFLINYKHKIIFCI